MKEPLYHLGDKLVIVDHVVDGLNGKIGIVAEIISKYELVYIHPEIIPNSDYYYDIGYDCIFVDALGRETGEILQYVAEGCLKKTYPRSTQSFEELKVFLKTFSIN